MYRLLAFVISLFVISDAIADNLVLARQPKSFISDTAQPTIECALTAINQDYKIVQVPWKRAQLGTQHQKYDGFFVATETAKRNEYATRSVGILSNDWLFIQSAEAPIAPSNSSFWARKFTANLGTAKLKWLQKKANEGIIQGQLVEVGSIKGAWNHLLKGNADILLENRINFEQLQKDEPTDIPLNISIAKEVSQGVYFSNSFLNEKTSFLTSFNSAVKECQESQN